MINEETMILNLDRAETIRILQALLSVQYDFEDSAKNAENEESRNRDLSSAKMWADIREKVQKQFDLQDALLLNKYNL